MKMEAVRTLLEEAVYNVCDNAIKYNRNDGSVSVFLTQIAQEIQIVVKDTGVGIPKEDQDRVFERFYRVDKSHSKEIGGTGLGLSIVKHAVGDTELVLKLNGSDIQLIANPVIRDKKTEGAVVLLVNVTEKLERESLRREFSANVSHELKTPLTSISGFAEIMQGGLVKNEDIPKFAGRIYKESQRLLQLVEDVIQISQLDEEKTSYVWEPVDVYQVCKNAFESLKEKAKRLNVHLYICGERMKMEAVRTLLEEAIYNVCDNAIKYNRNDGSVSVFLTQTAQEIQIVVKDTGVGIPKEDQNRVFERFYRVDKSHSKEIGGTGLGLSIVKHAVGALKGSVILRSEEGNGTEICMKFPKVHKE